MLRVGLYNFTASYEGTFRPDNNGDYSLVIEGDDDGYRVYINGEKVIDYWGHMPVKENAHTPSYCRKGL